MDYIVSSSRLPHAVASVISPSYWQKLRHKAVRSCARGHAVVMSGIWSNGDWDPGSPISRAHALDLYTMSCPWSSSRHSLPRSPSQVDLTLVQKVLFSGGHVQWEEGSPPQRGGRGHLDPGKNKDDILFNTRVSFIIPVQRLFRSSPGWRENIQARGFSSQQVNKRPFAIS